jgi:1-acyl-sn-glycerol-3-phosphate acyltransferase
MVLYDDFLPKTPFVGDFFSKTGGVLACWENGVRLLDSDHWVLVCPEGTKGVGKYYWDRYKLVPFGNGGFVRLALETRAPIIPISVVGPEEIYPIVYKSERLGRMFNVPYIPVTMTFPWLGLLGLVPFPSKWSIWYDEPIRPWEHLAEYRSRDALVKGLCERVRGIIQQRLDRVVAGRRSVLFG